ncbi:MAG: hypothetical protein ACOC22_01660 [bacterium]
MFKEKQICACGEEEFVFTEEDTGKVFICKKCGASFQVQSVYDEDVDEIDVWLEAV